MQVKSVRLVGVLLIVYIKDIHVDHVSLIDSDTVPTGILGLMVRSTIAYIIKQTSLCSTRAVPKVRGQHE